MKRQPLFPHVSSPHAQRGIATILIVVLIGVALTATAMSIMHSMRSAQEKHIAVHAATNAQTGAWTGVEAFRRYLTTLDAAGFGSLPTELTLEVGEDSAYGAMKAINVDVIEETSSAYRVSATIVNTLDAAHASAAVGVVYEVTKADDCPGCVKLSAALDFHDDLDVGGGITITMPNGDLPTINVDGDVSMMNLAPMTLGVLNTTGSVSLDSNMRVEEINSNGNVSLTGSATAAKVTTRGTVTTGGGGGATIIWANGAVTLGGVYRSDAVNSRSAIAINTGAHGDFKTIGNVSVGGDTTVVDEVQTKGNLNVNKSAVEITTVIAEGNLNCSAAGTTWSTFTSVLVNGSVSNSCTVAKGRADDVNDTSIQANRSNTVTPMDEIEPIVIPRMVVDVWTLRPYANYVFQWDAAMNRTKITVKNISGAPDGEYWIGKYADNQQDYLCKTFDGSGKCLTPAATLQACIGHSEWNPCLTPVYNTTNKTWTFDGKSALPGVLWFEGNVHLNNGYNYGTVLATGNVTTGGQMRIQSVNYAGFNTICKGIASSDYPDGYSGSAADKTKYTSTFSDQYPTNLCDMAGQKYLPIDVGNIAIAAGGYNPAGNGAYSGGNVTVGANNGIYGVVLAGGYLVTGGDTKIYGYVSAAVQGGRGVRDNELGGSTTVDLTRGNDNYDPSIVPDMTGGACPDCDDLGGSTGGESKVLWSKYL